MRQPFGVPSRDWKHASRRGDAARRNVGWVHDAHLAPVGDELLVSSTDMGDMPVIATLDGFDETGEPRWLFETEDGPVRICVQAWRPKGSWRQ